MGYIAHHAVVATGAVDPDRWARAVAAFKDQLPEDYRPLLVGPVEARNGYVSVAFLPNGAKAGSEHSDLGDELRAAFIDLCDQEDADWVLVRFGGDDEWLTGVERHSHYDPELP